jgi:hypothetical protein
MSTTQISQKKLIMLKQQVMLALFICYIPHIASEPWWLFGIFSAAIGYRLLADYYNYSRIPTWIIVLLTFFCPHYRTRVMDNSLFNRSNLCQSRNHVKVKRIGSYLKTNE